MTEENDQFQEEDLAIGDNQEDLVRGESGVSPIGIGEPLRMQLPRGEYLEPEEIIEDVSELGLENIADLWRDLRADMQGYYQEALEQSNKSFRAAAVAAFGGALFFLIALGVILYGVLAGFEFASIAVVALISALAGGLIEVISGLNFWLYRRASDQLAIFRSRMETIQEFILANIVTGQLDEGHKDQMRQEVVKTVLKVAEQQPLSSVK